MVAGRIDPSDDHSYSSPHAQPEGSRMSSTDKSSNRVIVVGAGPVGLVAAVALAAEGVPVTVIEALKDVAIDLPQWVAP